LFLIYINDLPDCSKLCAYLFADDTTLLAKNANLNKLFSDVNEEFRKVVYYFRAHRLVLHPDKTTFMLFSTANADTVNNKIYIDNNNYAEAHYNPNLKSAIHCVNNLDAAKVKFLGVLIDPNLNFRFHIKAISAKLSSALFHLRAVKNMLSQKALTALYYSLFHSHLIYAVQVWSSTAPSIIKELVKKQKQAIRIIHNAAYNAHTESLFKKSSILPLPLLAEFFKIQFMHHYKFNLLPISFNNTWISNLERRRRGDIEQFMLRNDEEYYVPLARTVAISNQPLICYPKLWNEFDEPCKLNNNKITFKRELKKYFLNKLETNYICERLLCPHCHL
jgi:hypothetical protein